MAEGWICPSCKRGVRPDKDTCDHGGTAALDGIDWTKLTPGTPPHSPGWYAARPITTCGSVDTVSDPNLMLWN